ncbi:MAG: hypothetical protein KC425_03645 [Anaerolineales bacterium]|nr:hypothetical protein [Anaerolineales bacterium]
MSQEAESYEIGDWIVHRHHGVGQITATRTSDISGKPVTYYEIETVDSTIWIPVDQLTEDVLRPILTPQEMREVVSVLQRPPRDMDTRYSARKLRIYRTQKDGLPVAMARLVRDMRARQEKRGRLSNTEQDALRSLTRKLLQEWAVCKGISIEMAQERLNTLLQEAETEANGAVPASVAETGNETAVGLQE